MDAYFDFSSLLSLVHSANDQRYGDCMRMIQDNFTIKFTFKKESIAEAKKDDREDIMQWFTNMASGLGDLKWDSLFPENPIRMDEIKKYPNNSSVYCLDDNIREDLDKLIDKGIVIVGKTGSELNLLSNLHFKSQYIKNIFQKVDSWDCIKNYISPCSDIIIVDQFILSSPELYESNLYNLVKCLADKCNKNEKINIVIVTLKKTYDRITHREFEPDWDRIYSEMRQRINPKNRPNITFVTALGNKLEHDRSIFTNYKTYASGDSYNYFSRNGEKITRGRYLHVHSLADKDNMDDANKLLKDTQDLINKLKSLNSDNIKKDMKCNFLTF